jgi:Helix-turn-helix domain
VALELMGRVIGQPRDVLDAMEKLVLFIMLDRADDDGVLWYAVQTIAEKASLTTRGVQKVVDRLIGKGLIKRMPRRNATNYYVVLIDKLPAIEPRAKRPKEGTLLDMLSQPEPDLFGMTGERGSGVRVNDVPGGVNDVPFRGEPRSPDSTIDSTNDSHGVGGAETLTEEQELYDLVVAGWNAVASRVEAISPIRMLTEPRKRLIELRTEEYLRDACLPESNLSPAEQLWAYVFDCIERSRLLTGKKTDWSVPNIDWILKASNFLKIMEGNYGRGADATDSAQSRSSNSSDRSAVAAGAEALALVRNARERRDQGADGAAGRRCGFAGAH